MRDSAWGKLLTACGIMVGGAVAWRFVKYFFSTAVIFWVISIVLVVKTICGTYVIIATMENESALESLKTKFIIESKTLEFTKKHEGEQAERELEMQRLKTEQDLEMQRLKMERELKMQRLKTEQELELRQLENEQKELDRNYRLKAYEEMERKIGEFNAEFYQNVQQEKELPNEVTGEQKRNAIRRNVLVAYGLSDDPLFNSAMTNTPIAEYKIVVDPSIGWPNPVVGTHSAPSNLTLKDIFKYKVSKEYNSRGTEYKIVEEISYQPTSEVQPSSKMVPIRIANPNPHAVRSWRQVYK